MTGPSVRVLTLRQTKEVAKLFSELTDSELVGVLAQSADTAFEVHSLIRLLANQQGVRSHALDEALVQIVSIFIGARSAVRSRGRDDMLEDSWIADSLEAMTEIVEELS